MNGHPTTLAWKQDVGGLTKLVLLALADHSGANWSVAYPSQQYLADKCGISRSSVVRALEELIDLGLVVKENRPNSSNRYSLKLQCQDDTTMHKEDTPVVSKRDNQCVREEHKPVLNQSPNQPPTKGDRHRDSGARELQLPEELDSPKFREAWEAFLQHLVELKKRAPTVPATQANFKKFVEWGHDQAVEAIWTSIQRGWSNIHLPRESTSKPGTEGATGQGESSAKKPSTWELRQQFDAVKLECDLLRSRYASEVAGGEVHWETKDHQDQYYTLMKMRNELNKQLAQISDKPQA